MSNQFEEVLKQIQAKKRAQQEQVQASPDVIIQGVVDAAGVGAGQIAQDGQGTLELTLTAWRTVGFSIRNTQLKVTKQVSGEELRELQEKIPAGSVITFRAKLFEDPAYGDAQAWLLELMALPPEA